MKEYKMSLIAGSILTISPSLAGIVLWNRLPEKIATHFDQHNLANGWSSKPEAVFGIPFLLLLVHLLCVIATANDPKRKYQQTYFQHDPVAGPDGFRDHLHVDLCTGSGNGY